MSFVEDLVQKYAEIELLAQEILSEKQQVKKTYIGHEVSLITQYPLCHNVLDRKNNSEIFLCQKNVL